MFNDPYFLMLAGLDRDLTKVQLRSSLTKYVKSAVTVAIMSAYEEHMNDMKEFNSFAAMVAPISVQRFIDKCLPAIASAVTVHINIGELISEKSFDAMECLLTYIGLTHEYSFQASISVFREYVVSQERTSHSSVATRVKEVLPTLGAQCKSIVTRMFRVEDSALHHVPDHLRITEGVNGKMWTLIRFHVIASEPLKLKWYQKFFNGLLKGRSLLHRQSQSSVSARVDAALNLVAKEADETTSGQKESVNETSLIH